MRTFTASSLVALTWLCLLLVAYSQDQPLLCYACTYRTVADRVVGEYCSDPFNGEVSANITCDSMCVKRIYKGGVEQIKRGCYSDIVGATGTCETYHDREVPNSDPPETLTQLCCVDSLCNHGNISTSALSVLRLTLFSLLCIRLSG